MGIVMPSELCEQASRPLVSSPLKIYPLSAVQNARVLCGNHSDTTKSACYLDFISISEPYPHPPQVLTGPSPSTPPQIGAVCTALTPFLLLVFPQMFFFYGPSFRRMFLVRISTLSLLRLTFRTSHLKAL